MQLQVIRAQGKAKEVFAILELFAKQNPSKTLGEIQGRYYKSEEIKRSFNEGKDA